MYYTRPKAKYSLSGCLCHSFLCWCNIFLNFCISLISLDFGNIDIVADLDNTIKISAPLYSYSFEKSDIVNVTILEALPPATKTNGANGGKYSVGYFYVSGYGGKQYLYLHKFFPNSLYRIKK